MSASSRNLPPSRERFGWFFHGGAHNGPFKLWPAAIQRSLSDSTAFLLSSSWRSLDFFDITGLPDKQNRAHTKRNACEHKSAKRASCSLFNYGHNCPSL